MAGFQNSPLTKFPLSTHPPGQATIARPGTQPPHIQYSPIGPLVHGQPTTLTPIGAKTKQFTGFPSPVAKK